MKQAESSRKPLDAQIDRFKQAALELECDEDETHWDERLKRVAKAKREKPE